MCGEYVCCVSTCVLPFCTVPQKHSVLGLADVEDYLKAQSAGSDVRAGGDSGVKESRRGARVMPTVAPAADVVVASGDAWQPDAEKSKKAAFGQ